MVHKGSGNIEFRHAVPGRIRVHAGPLQGRPGVARLVRNRLTKVEGVIRSEPRVSTGSLIVFYDQEVLGIRQVMRLLPAIIEVSSRAAQKVSEKDFPEKAGPLGHLSYQFLNTLLLTGFMGYILLRRIFFKTPLSPSPFGLTGMVAVIGALPLVRRAAADLRTKKIGLFPFLAGACGLALASGQALTALEIIWILAGGTLLEEYAEERARRAIRDILEVTPKRTMVLERGVVKERTTSGLREGDTVVVNPGFRIPADGMILSGEALVNEADITGRSYPELRSTGNRVFAGTTVEQGGVHIRAEKLGEETYLRRIAGMVEEALSRETEGEKKAEILAARLTRLSMATALVTFAVTRSAERVISVLLVMACPCATVLAAYTAVVAAIANAARQGILIKGGIHLEQMHHARIVCFDKTGTVTSTEPRVVDVRGLEPAGAEEVLALAAGAEGQSDHPMASAILEEAEQRGIRPAQLSSSETFVGQGVRSVMESVVVLVGNESFMARQEVDLSSLKASAKRHEGLGRTVVYVARNSRLEGAVIIANFPRPEGKEVMEWLRRDGIEGIILLSGDTEAVVKGVSREMGFDEYRAELMPEDKARFIEGLQSDGRAVFMVGDGVNDAPSLSRAAVGVAMGAGGSEVAVESADIALVNSDLRGLIFLRVLGHRAIRTMEQNFWIATTTNILGILLGALGWFSPVMTGSLHVFHSMGIILNSGRLLRWKPSPQED